MVKGETIQYAAKRPGPVSRCGDFAVRVNDFLTVGRQPDCQKVF